MPDFAYVGEPFAYDVFISYSHGADASGKGYLSEWSVAFATELERELRTDVQFRERVRVFQDVNPRPELGLDRMAPLTDGVRERVQASALLVILMSPDYLKSGWCADERKWWFEKQVELQLPPKEHAAVVTILPTSDRWPTELTDSRDVRLLGFTFYRKIGDVPRPLGWLDIPGAFTREARRALVELVGPLYRKLDVAKGRLAALAEARAAAAKLAQPGGQSLYLHGRADRHETWLRAYAALTDIGFEVSPDQPDHVEQDVRKLQATRERRVEALTECDALLLVGTDDARALDQDLVAVGKRDRVSARTRSRRPLPCAVLNFVGAPLETPARVDRTQIVEVDWIDGTSNPWVPGVQHWLSAKGKAGAAAEGRV
jgi:hypothetical protein